jgi:hypothetical protein
MPIQREKAIIRTKSSLFAAMSKAFPKKSPYISINPAGKKILEEISVFILASSTYVVESSTIVEGVVK